MWAIMAFGVGYFLTELVRIGKEPKPDAALSVVLVVLMIPLLPFLLRVPVWGIVTTERFLKIRNILRTYVVRWDDVEQFELGRHDPWPCVGIAVLKDGRRVPITAIQPAYPWSPANKFARRTIPALNKELELSRCKDRAGREPSAA